MHSTVVHRIFDQIKQLSSTERSALDELLFHLNEEEWQQAAEPARLTARESGLDQTAIDQAVMQARYTACRSSLTLMSTSPRRF